MINEYNQKEIGKRIRKLRDEKNFTSEQFAELINRSTTFVWEFETGKKGLSAESMYFISQALDVSLDFLVTGEDLHEGLGSIIKLLSVCTPKQLKIIEKIIFNMLEMIAGTK